MASEYARSLEKNPLFPSGTPTYDWLRSFLNRHPDLMMKKSKPLEKKRAALTMDQVNQWFDLLSKVIQENNLEHNPAQIFNCDESGK